jgi:hypothetical protein
MAGVADADLVEIAEDGRARPLGEAAALRMQSRVGRYHVLAGPTDLVLMRRAASGDGARACKLAGEISGPGALCDVLGFVGNTGWRGELVVHGDDAMRTLFVDGGNVVGAESTARSERLGEVLYGRGILTREQFVRCGDATATGSKRFGEAAVAYGFVAREALFGLMGRQTEEIFFATLLVGSGTFYFLDGFEEERLSSRQRLGLVSLLREGIRRMHETRYFRARIPSDRHVPVRAAQGGAPDGEASEVYEAIDDHRSVAEIGRALGMGEFDVTRAVFQLVQAGHVVIAPPHLAPRDAVDVYNRAIAFVLRELDAMDAGDDVREQLAAFASRSPVHAQLLAEAGPSDDGTFDPERAAQAAEQRGPEAAKQLAAFLWELGSYAIFLARPHAARVERERQEATLSMRAGALLGPLEPEGKAGAG